MKNLIARMILSIITIILFVIVFTLSNEQHWSTPVTIGVVGGLFIVINLCFTWLFWQSRKQQMKIKKDE